MKHICLTLSALAGLFLLGACQKGQEVSQEESSRTITITADSDVTKTLLSDAKPDSSRPFTPISKRGYKMMRKTLFR